MKIKKIMKIIAIAIGSIFCVLSIIMLSDVVILLPLFEGLPDKDIVFYNFNHEEIGFVNADGTGYETRALKVFSFRVTPSDIYTWNQNGKYLATRLSYTHYPSQSGDPILISASGRIIKCPSANAPYGIGRIQVIDDFTILTVQTDQSADKVILFDMVKCEQKEILYEVEENEAIDVHIRDASLSSQGDLLIWLNIAKNQNEIIVIPKNSDEELYIQQGYYPSWSPDGEYIVYSTGNIYQIRKDGSDKELLVKRGANPSWSPDGSKIVYRDLSRGDNQLFVFDLVTKESVDLGIEGDYPDWRK